MKSLLFALSVSVMISEAHGELPYRGLRQQWHEASTVGAYERGLVVTPERQKMLDEQATREAKDRDEAFAKMPLKEQQRIVDARIAAAKKAAANARMLKIKAVSRR